jgi:hypothetical protein
MLEILDGIIATGAVVLALSLVVQAIQQIIKQTLDLKSTYMRRELLALFGTPDTKKLARAVSKEVSSSVGKGTKWLKKSAALRKTVSEVVSTGVSLIPESMRSTEWHEKSVDVTAAKIVKQLADRSRGFGYKDLELLEGLDRDAFKRIVKSLDVFKSKSMKKKLDEVFEEIDTWFDLSMKAFQEHYERRMKYWSFAVSFIVVIAVNANLFEVYKDFATNKPLRDAAVAMGERFVAIPRDSIVTTAVEGDSVSKTVTAKQDSAIRAEIRRTVAEIDTILSDKTFDAWRWDKDRFDKLWNEATFGEWLFTIFGWLAMGLLVSLGAPFWYDFLKGVVGLKEKLRARSPQQGTAKGQ